MKHLKSLLLLAISMILAVTATSCSAKIEDEDAFLTEVSNLITASYEVNELLFGDFLPLQTDGKTYEEILESAGSPEAAAVLYLPVTPDAKYQTEKEIREVIEAVYSDDYCVLLNQLAFEGISSGEELVTYARFILEMEAGLTVHVESVANAMELNRTYDLSTLKIVRSQNGFWIGDQDYVVVSCDVLDSVSPAGSKELKVVRDPDGWRLDWPTY